MWRCPIVRRAAVIAAEDGTATPGDAVGTEGDLGSAANHAAARTAAVQPVRLRAIVAAAALQASYVGRPGKPALCRLLQMMHEDGEQDMGSPSKDAAEHGVVACDDVAGWARAPWAPVTLRILKFLASLSPAWEERVTVPGTIGALIRGCPECRTQATSEVRAHIMKRRRRARDPFRRQQDAL